MLGLGTPETILILVVLVVVILLLNRRYKGSKKYQELLKLRTTGKRK